jgi:hypothetical protein
MQTCRELEKQSPSFIFFPFPGRSLDSNVILRNPDLSG